MANTRFDNARKQLSDSFKLLEKTIKQKLQETAIQSRMIDVSEEYDSDLKQKIVEQSAIIQNLNSQINNLQKELENAGIEIEFLNEKCKMIADRAAKSKSKEKELVEEIENDLAKISELIKGEDQ